MEVDRDGTPVYTEGSVIGSGLDVATVDTSGLGEG